MLLSEDGLTLLKVNDDDLTGDGTFHIPPSVTKIGQRAFWGCMGLKFIHIPSNVASIGYAAFGDCTNLQQINFQEGITSIGDRAFLRCRSLRQITIPASVTSIGAGAFWACTSLERINLPEGITEIGARVFLRCISLRQINIPASVTSIRAEAFLSCNSLRKICIPESVTLIGAGAFWGCESLQQIKLPEGVRTVGRRAFWGCITLRQISIPASVTSIYPNAFGCCKRTESIFINNLDEDKRASIVASLPKRLRNKVVVYTKDQVAEIWNQQLSRVLRRPEANPLYRFFNNYEERPTHLSPSLPNEMLVGINESQGGDNPYYRKAKVLMKRVPLPTRQEGKQAYERKIQAIADECIQQAIGFNKKISRNNYSFLLDVLALTSAVGGLALAIAALVTVLVVGSQILSAALLVAGVGCGVAAAGTFFYHSCIRQQETQVESIPRETGTHFATEDHPGYVL
ncbi:leucine-rich repeat domain-containing protein [Legionella micdadei]|uniref:Leucine rich repeat-containing protein n=1 Tax=Legionella micdadei TaxID=451 RepID=A0A1G5HDN3_LEGMI|nr:leucine-rich repeat domain-containing protein [Legionella micdadei]ARG98303.1 hypothetical protein B6N58_11875 [Legionella micdadei]KTD27233.1 hypothetical protein Lmic_2168 [Legionella micdadei]NSL18621.1 leucine-rich repeat domain-containing protein [Legionella micdadei]SCY61893.1 Leucine rich repeat-containing protein [Legionella micdadei]